MSEQERQDTTESDGFGETSKVQTIDKPYPKRPSDLRFDAAPKLLLGVIDERINGKLQSAPLEVERIMRPSTIAARIELDQGTQRYVVGGSIEQKPKAPIIGQHVKRKDDGRSGTVRYIAVEGARRTRPEHVFMVVGDVDVLMRGEHGTSIVTHGSKFWEVWETDWYQTSIDWALMAANPANGAKLDYETSALKMANSPQELLHAIDACTSAIVVIKDPDALAKLLREETIARGIDAREPSEKQPGPNGTFATIGVVDGVDGPLIEIDTPEQCQSFTMAQARSVLADLRAGVDVWDALRGGA